MQEEAHKVRIPQQKRSIEKKNKIVEVAYRVFCEKGYNAVTTADIALQAGLATGSIYAYFTDKKDIFIAAFDKYASNVQRQLLENYEGLSNQCSMQSIIENIINSLVDINNLTRLFHREVMALMYLDTEVRRCYERHHEALIEIITGQLVKRGIVLADMREKTYLAILIIENVTRDIIYGVEDNIDKRKVIKLCEKFMDFLLKDPSRNEQSTSR